MPAEDQRKPEFLEQEQGKQRLHDEAAGETVDREQSGKLEHDRPGRTERGGGSRSRRSLEPGQSQIDHAARDTEQPIKHEHRPHCCDLRDAERLEQLRAGCCERAQRRCHRAGKAIAGERDCPATVLDRARQHRVLGWHEDAGVARRRIEGAEEGDQEHDAVVTRHREAQARDQHQCRGGQQQCAIVEAIAEDADGDRAQGRAQQRQRGYDADLNCAQAERRQIDRQQDCGKAIPEIAQ